MSQVKAITSSLQEISLVRVFSLVVVPSFRHIPKYDNHTLTTTAFASSDPKDASK